MRYMLSLLLLVGCSEVRVVKEPVEVGGAGGAGGVGGGAGGAGGGAGGAGGAGGVGAGRASFDGWCPEGYRLVAVDCSAKGGDVVEEADENGLSCSAVPIDGRVEVYAAIVCEVE